MSPQDMLSRKFKLNNKLTTPKEFDTVFEKKEVKISTPSLLILARRNNYNRNRLGMIVSKRSIPQSVQRNKIKRHIRETFRHLCTNKTKTMDIVVMTRRRITIDRNLLKYIQKAFKSLVNEFEISKSI